MTQAALFPEEPIEGPPGFVYQPGFLDGDEEAALLAWIGTQPLLPARYKGFTARREVLAFGGSFDFDALALRPADEIPGALWPLRQRVAAWLGLPAESLRHALIARYPSGAPLGWHRDVPAFEHVAGVSLGASATMRLRPWPPVASRRDIVSIELAPGSIYRLCGPARWQWQHCVPPVAALRHSITFRTLRGQPMG